MSYPLICICGCGQPASHMHHAVTKATINRATSDAATFHARSQDPRNLVPVHHQCHWAHHNHQPRFHVGRLPDSVFAFAAEVLGPGPAYERLIKDYRGTDPRLDALLDAWEAAA